MIIPKKLQKQIIDGLADLLGDSYEEKEVVKTLKGSSLINFLHIYKDDKGRPIKNDENYTHSEMVSTKINHERRIRHIIEESKDAEEMEKRLGEYLAKYAKSKEDVINKIKSSRGIKKK